MIKYRSSEDSKQRYEHLIEILGSKLVNAKIESPFDFITAAVKGLDSQAITNFRNHFGLQRDFTAGLLNVSEPTVYRWINDKRKLDRNRAILLFEVTNLFLYGIDVFESKDNFFKWLELPNTALGGLEPKQLLEVPGGIARVEELLGRIEYGVLS
jgi:putative toxin-antitoxin system antitoxin component (TIGR02293 family)